jgi:hypothetical protein
MDSWVPRPQPAHQHACPQLAPMTIAPNAHGFSLLTVAMPSAEYLNSLGSADGHQNQPY